MEIVYAKLPISSGSRSSKLMFDNPIMEKRSGKDNATHISTFSSPSSCIFPSQSCDFVGSQQTTQDLPIHNPNTQSTELTLCSLQVGDLVEQIKQMQQTIAFLKLSSEERVSRSQKLVEESTRTAEAQANEIAGAIKTIQDHRDKVKADLKSTFSRLHLALDGRRQLCLKDIALVAEQSVSKYRAFLGEVQSELSQAESNLAEISNKTAMEITEADISLKPSTLKTPKFDFDLSFICNSEQTADLLQRMGSVAIGKVKAPYECRHFLNVSYWMLPACCYLCYCCNKCHDLTETHKWQYARRMVCMHCDKEQDYRKLPNLCESCRTPHRGVLLK